MSLLMLVRRAEDLPRSCVELNHFLSFSRTHYPAKPLPLLGIWIDPHMVGQPPSQALRIDQTLEFQGLWTLCWLQPIEALHGHEITRSKLASILVEAAKAERKCNTAGYFIPVFPSATSGRDAQKQWQQLSLCHPQILLAPWFQHAESGLLMQPITS